MPENFKPEAFAQRQLDAYNDRDLDRFVREYTEDVLVYRLPGTEPILRGRVEVAAIYEVTPDGIAKVWFVGSE